MPDWNDKRMPTPWGKADSAHKVADGIYCVSTPSHGGYMVGKAIARERLSSEAQAAGMTWGNWVCYEEDCQWAVLADAMVEVQRHAGRYWDTQKMDETFEAHILHTLKQWEPEYYAHVIAGVTAILEKHAQKVGA
jgi:hypothetical protein